jgi:hypothetical protein
MPLRFLSSFGGCGLFFLFFNGAERRLNERSLDLLFRSTANRLSEFVLGLNIVELRL